MGNVLKNKIMIVDDDESVIFPIEMTLQERGLQTISFNDGEQALEYLKNNKVSIILLDYHMEPHINGDEFIRRFREFDNDTIIYLQTAYSEELPAIDMLKKYQIQGYIDKGKRSEERMQLIISALKHAEIIELVKEQQKEIDARSYKEEFLGKFLGLLMGEIKEKSFGIVGCIDGISEYENQIKDEKEMFGRLVNNIRSAINDLNELVEKLDINKDTITFSELKISLEKLFFVICAYKSVNLNIQISDGYRLIDRSAKTVMYILTDIIQYLIDNGEKQIDIQITETDNSNKIVVNNEINGEDILDKIHKLAKFDERIIIKNEDKLCIYC